MKYRNLFSFYQIDLGRKNYITGILMLVAIELLCIFSSISDIVEPSAMLTGVHTVVIIGAMMLGPGTGAFLGMVYGITGIWQVDTVSEMLLFISMRVVFGALAGLLFRWLFRSRRGTRCGFCVVMLSVISVWIYSILNMLTAKLLTDTGIHGRSHFSWEVAINHISIWIVTALVAFVVNWFCARSYHSQTVYEKRERKLEGEVETARRANEAKTSFLSSASHDMRTPLNVIIGLTEIAKENLGNREKIRECVEEISLSSYQLLSLINNVLEMGKIESGALELNPVGFSLTRQVEQLERVVMHRVESRKQTFVKLGKWTHDYLKGDAIRLYRVLLNVLSNAVKYTPEGGRVEFTVDEIPASTPDKAAYRFVISDNGIGMSEEFLQQMGKPFLREEDNPEVRKIQGTGLGVTITQNILKAMGGTIEYQSERGRGTTVTICLEFERLARDLVERESQEDKPKQLCQGVTLLVAEDNDLNWKIAEELLGYRGVRAHRAENGQECVEMFRNSLPGTYQAILMDVQMPVKDGLEAAMEIRFCQHKEAETIPIIAMTANAFSEDEEAAMKAGMNYYVSKPIDMEVLMKTLTDAIKK